MKVLNSIFYLILLALLFFLQTKKDKWQSEGKTTEKKMRFIGSLITYFILLISFIQFWLLTKIFPFNLILVILIMNMLIWLINEIIGAITGFGLSENKEKITALTFLWGAQQQKVQSCLILLFSLIYCLFFFIAPLWIYWTHPAGDPKTILLIALYQFTIPVFIGAIMLILLNWAQLTSPFIDDDLRNARLTSGFCQMITYTIYLFFPLWLFNGNLAFVENELKFHLPAFWVLVSIPILLFIIGSLIPFFVGIYIYRAQVKLMINWKKRWLQEALSILKLPAGDNRTEEWKNKLDELKAEVTKRGEENDLLKFYIKLSSGDLSQDPFPIVQQKFIALADGGNIGNINEEVSDDSKKLMSDKNQISRAKEFIRGKFNFTMSQNPELDKLFQKLDSYKTRLVLWDLRFGYLNQLLTIFGTVVDGDKSEIKEYISDEISKAKDLGTVTSTKKNWLAGIIITGISSGIVYFFNHYEDKIISFITHVVNTA